MAKKPRENRVPIMMSDEELTSIDDWRFANRVATRSDAVRKLCQVGLIALRKVPEALRGQLDGVKRLELARETASERIETLASDLPEPAATVLRVALAELNVVITRETLKALQNLTSLSVRTDVANRMNMGEEGFLLLKETEKVLDAFDPNHPLSAQGLAVFIQAISGDENALRIIKEADAQRKKLDEEGGSGQLKK